MAPILEIKQKIGPYAMVDLIKDGTKTISSVDKMFYDRYIGDLNDVRLS